jgi:hypothetical protein
MFTTFGVFCLFSAIKMRFAKNQHYVPIFPKTCNILNKNVVFTLFERKYFKNHSVGPKLTPPEVKFADSPRRHSRRRA